MNFLKILIVSLFIFGCCQTHNQTKEQKNKMNLSETTTLSSIDKINLKASTRGTQIKISISPEMYEYNQIGVRPEEHARKITEEEWEHLSALFTDDLVEKLPELKVVDQGHKVDAGAGTTITVFQDKDSIKSVVFNGANPPEELKEIVETIFMMKKKK